jgi:F-box and leucine-rich repeat protein 2/20
LKLTSLNISNQPTIPTKGLQAFSQKITTLTSLTCSNIANLHTNDFILIADCFPLLEELDLSFPKYIDFYDDFEINALSLVLPKLRKVNLSRSYYINDSSLYHLCKNCEILEEVFVFNCKYLTQTGIASAIRERPNLKSLSLKLSEKVISMELIDSLRSLKGLSSLDLSFSSCISDQLLSSLADEGLPLKRLVLSGCSNNGYTCSFQELYNLLSKCHSLKHLDLQSVWFLSDYRVDKLSVHHHDLVSINLNRCWNLTESSFVKLVVQCPFLEEIRMECTFMEISCLPLMNYVVSLQ